MEAYFVRVLANVAIGAIEQRAISVWIVCADNAEEAERIIGGRLIGDQKIQGINQAPEGTAQRHNLILGQARRL
jgi:hypothetical protein